MAAILVKACTNCGGDVNRWEEIDGYEYRCIQCGRPMDVAAALTLLEQRRNAA